MKGFRTGPVKHVVKWPPAFLCRGWTGDARLAAKSTIRGVLREPLAGEVAAKGLAYGWEIVLPWIWQEDWWPAAGLGPGLGGSWVCFRGLMKCLEDSRRISVRREL